MGKDADILMKTGGTVVSALGEFRSGSAAKSAGRANRRAYDTNARLLEKDAGLTEALAQRRYIETKEQGRYITGEQVAMAGASGGGVDDPTVLNIIAKTQARNELDAMYELWQGYNDAESMRNEAVMQRYVGQLEEYGGELAAHTSRQRGLSTLMTGMVSVYQTAKKRSEQRKPKNKTKSGKTVMMPTPWTPKGGELKTEWD